MKARKEEGIQHILRIATASPTDRINLYSSWLPNLALSGAGTMCIKIVSVTVLQCRGELTSPFH